MSPVAPEDVASAASVKTSGPAIVARLRDGAVERDQPGLHPVPVGPELGREAQRLGLGGRGVGIRRHEDLGAELGHVSEGVADHDAGGERGAVALDPLALADQVAVAAGGGDQFVAADQRRDDDPRDDRPGPTLHDPEQQARRPRGGIGEVDMRIGVVERQPVDLTQHPVGADAVQVERDDEGLSQAR